MPPVSVIVPPVALLPLAIVVLPVYIIVPPVALLPLAVTMPPVACYALLLHGVRRLMQASEISCKDWMFWKRSTIVKAASLCAS